jgi:transposase
MKKYINEMFNLQGLLVSKVECLEEQNQIIVHCRSPRIYCHCPACESSTKKIHQCHYRRIKHDRLNEKQIILNLKVRRFKCGRCKKVFSEKIVGIDRKKSSLNFRMEVISWLQRNSFNYIGQRFKMSGSTLNRYVLSVSNCWFIDWNKIEVTKLGIDEHSFRGNNLVITITDISHHKLLAILKTDRQRALIEFLNSIPKKAKDNIKEVCIDLKQGYKKVIKQCLPKAEIVADRYHVETLAKRMVDEIRTVVQEEYIGRKGQLKKLLLTNYYLLNDHEKKKLGLVWEKYEHYPVLKQAWLIKEKIVHFYQLNRYEKAKENFKYITMLFETVNQNRYLETTGRTWKNWREQILNYFKDKTTNGFTEGCHTKIKMMKRVSFGFRNIDNYIAKMMLAFVPLIVVANHLINHHTN